MHSCETPHQEGHEEPYIKMGITAISLQLGFFHRSQHVRWEITTEKQNNNPGIVKEDPAVIRQGKAYPPQTLQNSCTNEASHKSVGNFAIQSSTKAVGNRIRFLDCLRTVPWIWDMVAWRTRCPSCKQVPEQCTCTIWYDIIWLINHEKSQQDISTQSQEKGFLIATLEAVLCWVWPCRLSCLPELPGKSQWLQLGQQSLASVFVCSVVRSALGSLMDYLNVNMSAEIQKVQA